MSALHSPSTTRRLQLILIILIVWDVFGLLAEVSFGGPLVEIDGDQISGLLGARVSMSGAFAVTALAYVYALVRGPVRHSGVLWLGVVEQGAAALFAVLHVAAGDIELAAMLLPLAVSLALLVLLLLNMPRSQSGVA